MTTLNSLRIQRDTMALESAALTNAVGSLGELVKSFSDYMSINAGFLVSDKAGVIALNSDQQNFLKQIEKINFRDMEQLTAYVPEGLKAKYLPYVGELELSAEYCQDNTMQLLLTLNTYIANLINNEHALSDAHSFTAKLNQHEKERFNLNDAVAKCFGKGSVISQRKLGDVIDRNNDWKPLFETVTQINRSIDTVDKTKLNKKLKDVNELLDVFKRKFEEGKIVNVSPEVTENLSNLLYQTACEMEFFSVTYYRVLALTTSINRTTAHLQTMFKH